MINFRKFNKKYSVLQMTVVVFSVLTLVVLPMTSFGQETVCNPSSGQLCNPIKYNSIQCLFKAVLGIAAEIGSVFVVLGLIYSGFLFVIARGNEEELSKAKKAITYTVIGAAIVLGAWAFSVGIANTINLITQGGAHVDTAGDLCP